MAGDRRSRRDLLTYWLGGLRNTRGHAGATGAEGPERLDPDQVLRPPGALEPDDRFLEACTGCGDCVPICPVSCIVMREVGLGSSARASQDAGAGSRTGAEQPAAATRSLPAIIPSAEACRLCTELPCVEACPEGALVDPGGPRRVRIGIAQVDPRRCVTFSGQICTICFKACPYPNQAISLIGTRPLISRSACTGCGLCEQACPERPKAVLVRPERQLVPGLRVPREQVDPP